MPFGSELGFVMFQKYHLECEPCKAKSNSTMIIFNHAMYSCSTKCPVRSVCLRPSLAKSVPHHVRCILWCCCGHGLTVAHVACQAATLLLNVVMLRNVQASVRCVDFICNTAAQKYCPVQASPKKLLDCATVHSNFILLHVGGM